MCMKDIDIGRRTGAAEGKFSLLAGVAARVIPANKNRVALLIAGTAPAAAVISLGFDNTVTNLNGMSVPGGGNILYFNIREHGEIVRRELWAFANTNQNFTFWEVNLIGDDIDTR